MFVETRLWYVKVPDRAPIQSPSDSLLFLTAGLILFVVAIAGIFTRCSLRDAVFYFSCGLCAAVSARHLCLLEAQLREDTDRTRRPHHQSRRSLRPLSHDRWWFKYVLAERVDRKPDTYNF